MSSDNRFLKILLFPVKAVKTVLIFLFYIVFMLVFVTPCAFVYLKCGKRSEKKKENLHKFICWAARFGTSLFGLVEDLNGKAKIGSASASLAWFFADNFSVGARFSYDKKQIDVNDATVLSLLPFQNKHVTSMQMSASLSCRGYILLFDSRIFAVFGEASLNGKRGYSMDYQETDRGEYGTYGDDFSLSLGLYSGISLFLNDLIAIEISIPFLEGGYSWSDLLKGGELRSSQSHGFASYKPDFLGIRIGVTFNF